MTAFETQIVYAYESLGHTPKEIASLFEEHGETEESVLATLSNYSSKYISLLNIRGKASTNGELMDEEEAELLQEYRLLSRKSDNDLVKERALKFLINEKKGRNDVAVKTLKLKEKQANIDQVDAAVRGQVFIEQMKKINAQIQQALGMGPTIPIQQLEDSAK